MQYGKTCRNYFLEWTCFAHVAELFVQSVHLLSLIYDIVYMQFYLGLENNNQIWLKSGKSFLRYMYMYIVHLHMYFLVTYLHLTVNLHKTVNLHN